MKTLLDYYSDILVLTFVFAFAVIVAFPLSAVAQPSNDECVNSIEVFNGVTPYDNIGATNSPPVWSCAIGGSDVWFEYTATCTGDIIFETCNSGALPETNYDSAIQIFFTNSCADLDIADNLCNDDSCGLQSSLIVMPATRGETYLIRLGGFAGNQGEGHLEITPQENCESIVSRNVPTLSEWGLIAMAGVLGIVGFMVIRRRKATA